MKKLIPISAVLLSTVLSGCATCGSVGDYAMGDDSADIKQGRNKESAQLSVAELRQHRRQRQNTSEELALEAQKRQAKRDEFNGTLATVNNGLMTTNGVIGTVRNLRWGF